MKAELDNHYIQHHYEYKHGLWFEIKKFFGQTLFHLVGIGGVGEDMNPHTDEEYKALAELERARIECEE